MIAGAGVALEGIPGLASTTNNLSPDGNTAVGAAETASSLNPAATTGGFTRGIGVYPGDPRSFFGPSLVADSSTYRNLALLRPAYHSSAYDYYLTAQLITDGIKDTRLPTWIATATSTQGTLRKNDRENFLDMSNLSAVELRGANAWVQVEIGGGESAPEIDTIKAFVVAPSGIHASQLKFTVLTSSDGREWTKAGTATAGQPASLTGYPPDFAQSGSAFHPAIALSEPSSNRFYRIECNADTNSPSAVFAQWRFCEATFFRQGKQVRINGPHNFTSAWMSAGSGTEWVYVDLGARSSFDRIKLHWISRAAEGSIQVSDDASNWRDIQPLPQSTENVDDIKLGSAAQGRYVRILMTRPTGPYGYILSELEVYGQGGLVAKPHEAAPIHPDGKIDLAGGTWRVQRSSQISGGGEAISKSGFRDDDWVIATVPGTVLTSYVNAGAVPDPNFGENQLYISDSFFYSDFWYRTEFMAPAAGKSQISWLNFDGINWKADVYLNGEKLGRIEGGFLRAKFDVSGKLLAGQKNALAVKIERNATPGTTKQKTFDSPGQNGGALGADNPTYHASIGWDWIPTIRGRNIGIWGNVSLTQTGAVTIENPFVSTTLPLPDTSKADINIEVSLKNNQAKPVSGVLRGHFGDIRFEQKVLLAASELKTVKLNPTTHPALRMQNPKLWWPIGYGDPNLYDVELSFVPAGQKASDTKAFKAGVRQMTASEEGGDLRLWVNGRRLVAKGGNWGFGESMLLYRAREYDAAVRYHREMNFTMIRNWVGQIGDEEFYEACDRHGVMVWQDFWLANPWDGPSPNDDDMFLKNAKDFILKIRNHASIGLYCGRNEGFPPDVLEKGFRQLLKEYHPGLHYIPSSADVVVSGHGPYQAMPLSFYFTKGADKQLHSEMGMPNIPPIESVRQMMAEKDLWPQGLAWGIHDFCLHGAQGGYSFRGLIEDSYGGADSAEEWVTLAQFLNYEGYRAMFEGQSKYRMGLLLWMSHPCWPSFVWQTYDYYFEPTAAYFGCKKGSEPLHIQWNRTTENIEVVNYSGGNRTGLTAQVEVLNLDGSKQWEKSATLDSKEDSTANAIKMQYPAGLTPVHFLRLTLKSGSEVVSTNFYLRGLSEGDYRAIRQLPKMKIDASTNAEKKGDSWMLTTVLQNTGTAPALMVRLKAVRETSGDRILPAIYSDNYIALMPGEKQTITTELYESDTRGEKPKIVISGFNVAS